MLKFKTGVWWDGDQTLGVGNRVSPRAVIRSPRYWKPLPRFRMKQSTCYHFKPWIGLLNYKALQAKILIDMVLDFSLAY